MSRSRIGVALVAVAGAVSLAACGGSSGGNGGTNTPTETPTPTQAAQPAMTLSPDKNLKDGQKITAVGTGFTPGSKYGATECANKGAATTAADCNLAAASQGVAADASGKVTIQLTVAAKFNGKHVDCTKKPGCIVSIANFASAAPTEVAVAQLHFKK